MPEADRITKIAVTFSNGQTERTRVYVVIPETAFIKANNPQAKNPGYVEVKGRVTAIEDINV